MFKKKSKATCNIVCVEVGQERIYLKAVDDHVTKVEQPTSDMAVPVFTSSEHKLLSESRVSKAKAKSLATREAEEIVRVIIGDDGKEIYAAPSEWIATFQHGISSGMMAMTKAIRRVGGPVSAEERYVVGFALEENDSGRAMLILYILDGEGRLGKPQISIFTEDVNFIIEQFAQQNGMNADENNVRILGASDLREAIAGLLCYPTEDDVLGVPRSVVTNMAAVGSVAFCVVSATYAGILAIQQHEAESVAKANQNEVSLIRSEIDGKVSGHIKAFANAVSVDTNKAFERAADVWVPGGKVSMRVNYAKGSRFMLRFKMLTQTHNIGAESLHSIMPYRRMAKMMGITPPSGCMVSKYLYSGDLINASVEFTCPSRGGAIARFRGN